MKVPDATENHVGLCEATVIDDVYERDGAGRPVIRKGRPVVTGTERHRCSSMVPARCATRGHVCSHGRGWRDDKSEAR